MISKEIKKLLTQKGKAANDEKIQGINGEIEQATRDARFPSPETVEKIKVPVHFGGQHIHEEPQQGASTYRIEEYVIPAGLDPLDELRNRRQEEVGLAYIENRSPDISQIDDDIAKIEGARAALPILERKLLSANEEAGAIRDDINEVLAPIFEAEFTREELEYAALINGGIQKHLGHMLALSKVASRLGLRLVAASLTARLEIYVDALRNRGLVVRTIDNKPDSIYPPQWLDYRNFSTLPCVTTMEEGLKTEIAELGITL